MAQVSTSDGLGGSQGADHPPTQTPPVAALDLDYLTEPDDSENLKGRNVMLLAL